MIAIPDLYRLLFEAVLQLPRCTGSEGWGCWAGPENFAHDFIYALFLPHVIILLFLYIFSQGFGHRGLEILLGIGAYVFIIYTGLYSILAAFSVFWIILALFIGGVYFFLGKVIHPERTEALFGLAKKHAEKSKEKEKNIEMADEDLKYYRKKLKDLEKEYEEKGTNRYYRERKEYLKKRIDEIEREKRRME